MALAKLERIIAADPNTTEVNLANEGIDTIDPLVARLRELPRLKKLRLSGNNIRALPDDLTSLNRLELLDLSGNPVRGLDAVRRGLFSLTNLKHLYIDLPFDYEEDNIIVEMHSLQTFNGTPLDENVDTSDAPPAQAAPRQAWGDSQNVSAKYQQQVPPGLKTTWDDSDMQQAQRLYTAANSVSGRSVNQKEFDDYSRNTVNHLQTLLKTEEDPFNKEAEILKTKKIMFEYCFEEVARSAHKFDSNLSQVLSVLNETYSGVLDSYDRLYRGAMSSKERTLDQMRTDMQRALEDIDELMKHVKNKGGSPNTGSTKETRALREEVARLESEKEKLQSKLRQYENLKKSRTLGSSMALEDPKDVTSPNHVKPPPPGIGSKVLTHKQLKDAVEDIYSSKSKFDIKCADTHLPRETMEQHMYTHLNQKYGLKHLILEWASAIIQGVRKYAGEDNDISVFGKILRNEVDEEFRFVQKQLKETVTELLRVYLKGKNPLKNDDDINNMLRVRVNGSVLEEEWIDIVKYMYNTEDSVSIIMRIRDTLKQREQPKRRMGTRRTAAENARDKENAGAIGYQEFLKILLDFQLEGHERFLSRFVRIFRKFDTDRNGILNEHEFRQVLKTIDPAKSEEEIDTLLDLIDPHNNQLITFSECVTFLSSELVRMMKEDTLAQTQ